MEKISLKIFKPEEKKVRLNKILAMEMAKGCLEREKENQQLSKKVEKHISIKGGEKYIVVIKRDGGGKIIFHEFSRGKCHTREVERSHSIWNATGFIFS